VEQQGEFVRLCKEIVKNLNNEPAFKEYNPNNLLNYFIKLSGIFKTNAFCIYNEDKTVPIGAGIYIETSVFDHSCKPTAFFSTSGTKMQIRAIGDVLSNQKPFISYILAHTGKEARQKFLKQRYNFECKCERCENDIEERNVNFDRIAQLLDSQSSQETTCGSWRIVLKVHNELLRNFRKLYHEYDERITNQYYWTFSVISKLSSEVPKKVLNSISLETRDHLQTTYGSDYVECKKFEKQVTTKDDSSL
jgi:hypothetical protein